nr:hypothetical protein [Paracidovorax avenae]
MQLAKPLKLNPRAQSCRCRTRASSTRRSRASCVPACAFSTAWVMVHSSMSIMGRFPRSASSFSPAAA